MRIGFDAAAKGAPEMAFWPTAVSLLVYSQSPSTFHLIIAMAFMFTGSMSYLSIRQVKTLLEEISDRSSTRRNVSRDNKSLLQGGLVSDASRVTRDVLPNNQYIFLFVILSCLVNLLGGVVFFIELVRETQNTANPNAPSVLLAALPILYLFVLFSMLLWYIGGDDSTRKQ